MRETSGCSVSLLLKGDFLGTSISEGVSGEKQEHPCQVAYGRSEHPFKVHRPTSFGSHSIYGTCAD